ncbi:MAG TPA: LysR family transcriptional regulator [Microthrixaceae bacterium]|nr:LysR family transcriptional regulator [Microthrixaceae bacterium]
MDLKQLRALLAVSEHRSFSAAARALHTVQSNISTHVSRLEREMGVVLIDRATNALTEEGQVVAERARRIEAEFAALDSDVASLRDEVVGRVRLGVIGTTARWLVPPLLESLEASHPKVKVVVLDATTTSLIPQLISGSLELAVVNLPIDEPDVLVELLFDEDRVLVAPLSHSLAAYDVVTLADLAEHELLLPAQGTSFREELDAEAAARGVELKAKAEFDGMRLLASLAFSGFGAAVLPASASPAWLGGDYKTIPIDGLIGRSVGVARRRRGLPSAADRAVNDTLRRVVRSEAGRQHGIRPDESSRPSRTKTPTG